MVIAQTCGLIGDTWNCLAVVALEARDGVSRTLKGTADNLVRNGCNKPDVQQLRVSASFTQTSASVKLICFVNGAAERRAIHFELTNNIYSRRDTVSEG